MASCFEIIWYHDWWKKKKKEFKKIVVHRWHADNKIVMETPLDLDAFLSICQEFHKFMKDKNYSSSVLEGTSSMNFSGSFSCSQASSCIQLSCANLSEWIVDSRVSDHMNSHFDLLANVKHLSKHFLVCFPNKSTKLLSIVGQLSLNLSFTIHHCLFVSGFKHNLLSISKPPLNLPIWLLNFLVNLCYKNLPLNPF